MNTNLQSLITEKELQEDFVKSVAGQKLSSASGTSQTSPYMPEKDSPLTASLRLRDTSPPQIVQKCWRCEKLTPAPKCYFCSAPITDSAKDTKNDTQTGAKNTDSSTPSEQSQSLGFGSLGSSKLKEGTKADGGKVGVHLLPPYPLIEIAKVLDFGAKKYDPWNWSKGIKYSRVFGALLRHLWAWWTGRDNDEESGLPHLAHAGCCLLFLLQYTSTRKEYDDRPVKELS